jgi:hypothetical protein
MAHSGFNDDNPVASSKKLERPHHIRVLDSMKYLPVAFALVFGGTLAVKAESGIEFGKTRTRFEIQKELTARKRLRPWETDWRNAYAWQQRRQAGRRGNFLSVNVAALFAFERPQ